MAANVVRAVIRGLIFPPHSFNADPAIPTGLCLCATFSGMVYADALGGEGGYDDFKCIRTGVALT